ncbi:hypothetical protein EST38_g4593 [Candolleomyces aberdarensis]|uniref:Uncharacterized protein n=1 Tax=Candolleomyces aberdarensis TaxID=2316362 RepID=A0A4Q2DML6_9AGAR|nr:hypothetical protein EST38_g4593 [Candolleomyces aberdarensis]
MDLRCHSAVPLLTQSPVTLPELESFRFKAHYDSLFLNSLFDILTLPALSRLEVSGSFVDTLANSMCRQVLGLIQRSKCSLQHFDFAAAIDSTQETLWTILRLSPNLRDLSLRYLRSNELRRFVLKSASPNDPSNLVPNLKKITVHQVAERGGGFGPVDAVALAEVVVSRTEQVYGPEKGQSFFEPLTEVDLINYDVRNLEIQWKQTISNLAGNSEILNEGATASSNVEDGLDDIVTKMEDVLAKRFTPYPFVTHEIHTRLFADTNLHCELDQEMRTMENLDLDEYQDVAILGRRSIPHLLCRVSQLPPNTIPGDDVLEFRSRAKKLLDKWKPFIMRDILRDSLASPYIWRYGRNRTRLLCRHSFDESADEVNDRNLKQCGTSRISWENTCGPYNVIAVSSAEPYGEPLIGIGEFDGSTTVQWKAIIPAGAIAQISFADSSNNGAWSRS